MKKSIQCFATQIKITICALFYFLFISSDLFSQTEKYDRIYKQDQSFFNAVIVDTSTAQIKYKDPESQKIQQIPKKEVSAIVYSNGKTAYFSVSEPDPIPRPVTDTTQKPKPLPEPSKIRVNANMLGLYFGMGKVIGKSSEVDSTRDFPLGTGLGGNIQFQHFFADSNLAFYAHAGIIIWKSQGEIYWKSTANSSFTEANDDTLSGAIIDGKLTVIPVQLGLKYYKKYFYGFFEAGINFTNKTCSITNNEINENFLLADSARVNVKRTRISFAPGIGYEIKVGTKSFFDLNLRYQHILYPDRAIGFIGFKIGYNFLF